MLCIEGAPASAGDAEEDVVGPLDAGVASATHLMVHLHASRGAGVLRGLARRIATEPASCSERRYYSSLKAKLQARIVAQ